MASVRVGLFPPVGHLGDDPEQLRAAVARAAEEGIDPVCVGDHVSFFVGAGSDRAITATAMLAAQVSCRCTPGLPNMPFRRREETIR